MTVISDIVHTPLSSISNKERFLEIALVSEFPESLEYVFPLYYMNCDACSTAIHHYVTRLERVKIQNHDSIDYVYKIFFFICLRKVDLIATTYVLYQNSNKRLSF